MSNQIVNPSAPQKASALALMAARFSVDPDKLLNTLKSTVFKGATNEELMALVVVANEFGLNPLLKEIYAFPAKGGGIVPVVSVDGWNNLANSHPAMDGMEFEFSHDDKGGLVSCTCIIYRKDRSRPIKVTEYLSECRRNTEPWKMEHRMLRHKALIQCVRIAFGFSGVVDEEDGREIAGIREGSARVVETEPKLFGGMAQPAIEEQQEQPEQEPATETPALIPHEHFANLLTFHDIGKVTAMAALKKLGMAKPNAMEFSDVKEADVSKVLANWDDFAQRCQVTGGQKP